MMKKYIIVVAGGKGLRMGGDIPKQFIPIKRKPVLMRTLEAFHAYDAQMELILVLPVDHQPYWKSLCEEYHFSLPHRIANGGETRFHSVRNGLALIEEDGAALEECLNGAAGETVVRSVVGVHDGVRPFVAPSVIDACYAEAAQGKAVVPVIDVVETVRHLLPDASEATVSAGVAPGVSAMRSETVPRGDYKLVQTPQVFPVELLKRAYSQEYIPHFTDDASVVEALGCQVTLVPGNRENIKLTTPFDLKVAEALID